MFRHHGAILRQFIGYKGLLRPTRIPGAGRPNFHYKN